MTTQEYKKIKAKYPDKTPIIISGFDRELKYLAPYDFTISQLVYVIRRRLRLSPEISIVLILLNNNTIPTPSKFVSEYEDNTFVRLYVKQESTFGCMIS